MIVLIYLDVLEDIPFGHPSTVTYFQSSIFYIRNACFHGSNSAMNMLVKNRGYDLDVISKQLDT